MNLINFYREQFVELCSQFEPYWMEDNNYVSGMEVLHSYRYKLYNAEFIEFFQMIKLSDAPLYFVFSLELPYEYRLTNIYEFTEQFVSEFVIAVHFNSHSTLLSSSIVIHSLNQSVLGFLNRARGELIDIVYSIVQQKA